MNGEHASELKGEKTPMGSVWKIVLGTVAITSIIFGGYQWWKYEKARAAHRAAIEASEKFRAELSDYIAYLNEHGTGTPEKYFTP